MLVGAPAITLAPRAPFDARPILGYYGRSPLEPLDIVMEGAWRRAVRLDGQVALVEAAAGGTAEVPAVTVRLLAGARGLLGLAGGAVAQWWRIDQDSADLGTIAARDPILGQLLARLYGARAPLMASPFECLVWAILGQQITVAFAYKMKRALVERYGDSIAHDGRTYWLFPEPERLAEADPAELRELQFSRQKSEYVRGLAALAAAGGIDWGALAAMPSDEAIRALTALRGVGRWTAEYVLMRGLGHTDVIPAADVGLQAAIGRAYGLGRKATEAEVRALAEQWAPRRSHAAWAWWWSLSADRVAAAAPLPGAQEQGSLDPGSLVAPDGRSIG